VFPVAMMCDTLGLSTSGYYEWLERSPSACAVANAELLEQIREVYRFGRQTYGRPRLYVEFRDDGVLVNHRRVGRLMWSRGKHSEGRLAQLVRAPANSELSELDLFPGPATSRASPSRSSPHAIEASFRRQSGRNALQQECAHRS
jgi:hypothetical protein